ncbi:hypothetical protein [Terricaulis sp.]|uniref:hypothetical protein n=1 Tax=Terricaulis sp. TaxID=2768686 RepID=UPI002AC48BC4|nr:hypothetical protein [Terricaulis sp.]MDZ4691297.1 hypothetical protein [Terricaulis sp.]
MTAANIKHFRPAAELVTSRNREEALKAMTPRLLELADRVVCENPQRGQIPTILVFAPGLMLTAVRVPSMPGATYVDVRLAINEPDTVSWGPKVFSAWFNCPPTFRGKYMNGDVHVMSWKRGWEGALVNVARQ